MTVLSSGRSIMEIEETDFRSVISDPLMKKIGSNINALIDAKDENYLIGMTFWAYLTETQVQAAIDSTWVEMKGQSIAGSDLDTLTGISTLPDCRGQFIRPLDDGAGTDPDSPRSVASLQAGGFRSHAHSMVGDDISNDLPGVPSPAAPYLGKKWATGVTIKANTIAPPSGNTGNGSSSPSAAESRPDNIALGFFIKVNN